MTLETKSDPHHIGLTLDEIVRRMVLPPWDPTAEGFPTRLARLEEEAPVLFELKSLDDGSTTALLNEFQVCSWLAENKVAEACQNRATSNEIKLLDAASSSRYDEYDRARTLWISLDYYDLKRASPIPGERLFVRYMPHPVFFWALHHHNQEIPEWAPPNLHLLLTIAWLLDVFMETKVENWKEVMVTDTKRPEERFWFRSKDLKVQAVTDAIQQELNEDKDISRTIKKHVPSAKQVILDEWRIENPLKPGEIEAANRTLCGLARATIKACASKDSAIKIPLDSTPQIAAFINAMFARPPGLSLEQFEHCLNECWE